MNENKGKLSEIELEDLQPGGRYKYFSFHQAFAFFFFFGYDIATSTMLIDIFNSEGFHFCTRIK